MIIWMQNYLGVLSNRGTGYNYFQKNIFFYEHQHMERGGVFHHLSRKYSMYFSIIMDE
jgi:hypothetical protein